MTTNATNATLTEEQWLTKAEAATILGLSIRAVERKAAAGEIATKTAARHGKRPATLYAPADVERIRAEMASTQRGASDLAPAPGAEVHALQRRDSDVSANTSLFATIASSALRAAAMPPRRWLKVEEASSDSGLSKRLLRRLCRQGELRYVWDEGDFKIDSHALAEWQPSANQTTTSG